MIQGGDLADVKINETKHTVDIKSAKSGEVSKVNALLIGEVSLALGAGRLTKESALDYDAGVQLIAKKGDVVKEGDLIAKLFSNNEISTSDIEKAQAAYIMK